jgi:hypothetical protein
MRVILAVVSRVKPAALAWLTAKDVEIAGRTVALTEPVPRDLLDHVLYAGRATQTPR